MTRLSVAAIAKEIRRHRRTVDRAIEAASLQPDGHGLFDFETVAAAVHATADPARIAGHAAAERGEATSSHTNTLAEAKAQSELMRAEKLRLEVGKRAGELVERQHVLEIGRDICAAVRVALLAVPSKVAPKLLDVKTALEAQHIVDGEIRAALGMLSDEQAFADAVLG